MDINGKTLIHIKQSCIFLKEVFLPQCHGWRDCEASDLMGTPLSKGLIDGTQVIDSERP